MKFKTIDYAETEEHRMVQDSARRYLADNLAPIAAELDEKEMFAEDILKGMGELGLLALIAPEEYGLAAGLSTPCRGQSIDST